MSLTPKDLDAMCQVVWFYRPECDVARKPGSFSHHLIRAFAHADMLNHARLSIGFPAYGFAMSLAMEFTAETNGMDELIALCRQMIAENRR